MCIHSTVNREALLGYLLFNFNAMPITLTLMLYTPSLPTFRRLADHFMGKQHIGFQLMRDQLEAIKNRREQRRFVRIEEKDCRHSV
jgi:hypothetical protein